DMSVVSIANARTMAQQEGLDQTIEFEVMDAEALRCADHSFDVIVVYGALHHLDLEKALHELARVLKPGGTVICTEALRHNPLIHWYRRLTPKLRTRWETDHILGRSNFKT